MATSKNHAPWHIIPADVKWFSRLAVSEVIIKNLTKLKPVYPRLNSKQMEELKTAKKILLSEK
jgi:hypothetical protein